MTHNPFVLVTTDSPSAVLAQEARMSEEKHAAETKGGV